MITRCKLSRLTQVLSWKPVITARVRRTTGWLCFSLSTGGGRNGVPHVLWSQVLSQGRGTPVSGPKSFPGERVPQSGLMARSHCTEGGTGNRTGNGSGSTVHIAVGLGAENIMRAFLHVLEIAPFVPCATVLIILQ